MDHGRTQPGRASRQAASGTVSHGFDSDEVNDGAKTQFPDEPGSSRSRAKSRKRTGSLRKAALAKMRERIVITPPTPIPAHGIASRPGTSSPSPRRGERKHYTTTTDEDEASHLLPIQPSSSNSSSEQLSAGPAVPSLRRRSRHSETRSSGTTMPDPTDSAPEEEWDYSETEWWGWVILATTWAVFVVVMGSCLGVWSWAWDVGETPYAPPDLEDDDTLPITGYYPALMVCTAVMSWVWVVVAWVGMKFFRHSGEMVVADDG
ncbi:hypothetical protein DE146DRAFT_612324 [Phaeosphaeria sp. MPI-PUGE-AT-0046c]|nr:hypothetical protein DE146DRAFT_612324 [Phaeosphaeria sp. MPI-PUGE-AT-0046c]